MLKIIKINVMYFNKILKKIKICVIYLNNNINHKIINKISIHNKIWIIFKIIYHNKTLIKINRKNNRFLVMIW